MRQKIKEGKRHNFYWTRQMNNAALLIFFFFFLLYQSEEGVREVEKLQV